MISDMNNDGGSGHHIIQRCDEIAAGFGQIYINQLMPTLLRVIRKLENRPITDDEFCMFVLRIDRRENKKYFSTFLWKMRPIVEVEFSDYFYIKTLVNQKQ